MTIIWVLHWYFDPTCLQWSWILKSLIEFKILICGKSKWRLLVLNMVCKKASEGQRCLLEWPLKSGSKALKAIQLCLSTEMLREVAKETITWVYEIDLNPYAWSKMWPIGCFWRVDCMILDWKKVTLSRLIWMNFFLL